VNTRDENEIKIVRNENNEKKTIEEKEEINGKKHYFIYIYICIVY